MDEISEADRALLADLRDALDRADPPPRHLMDAARHSLDWMDPDAALAELVSDSALAGAPAVRAAEPPRVLTFDAAGTTLVVEIRPSSGSREQPPTRHAIGQLMPPGAADVQVRGTGGDTVQARADEYGRFRTGDLPEGPLAISCRFDDAARRPMVTRWTAG